QQFLLKHCCAEWAGKLVADFASILVRSDIPKNYFVSTFRASKYVRPESEINAAFCFSVKVTGFIHPSTFIGDFLEYLPCFDIELYTVKFSIVVRGYERGSRRQRIHQGCAGAKLRKRLPGEPAVNGELRKNRTIQRDSIPQ